MDMTTDRRQKTGAYYTPRPWAELAVRYLRGVLPEFDRCKFYDPAAGEGALLNADLTRFTARQLMRELYARGYEGELYYTQRINIASCKR